jgi:hypothetical protein
MEKNDFFLLEKAYESVIQEGVVHNSITGVLEQINTLSEFLDFDLQEKWNSIYEKHKNNIRTRECSEELADWFAEYLQKQKNNQAWRLDALNKRMGSELDNLNIFTGFKAVYYANRH